MAPELHEGLGHVLNDGEARSSSEWIPASQNQSVLLHGWNGVFRKAASQVCRMRTSSRKRHQASILCRRCTGKCSHLRNSSVYRSCLKDCRTLLLPFQTLTTHFVLL
ncbi:hypothetical protein M758_1G290500 [Ceratodon purpureus]|uniref:Uncharacterized protein n=1 Tax=Ceratodon purpureus TaxID=3225 RepID=A0A8T0HFK0_CERPU|nr:hypothetical protein KC19_6G158900 [Ceratodon purpureus]KAG0605710.1 hypothetical protein M758_9G081800 [Ceratodon purpureus]KAG0605723.1 hypothetical protein M758_9G082800 [Ceratodon purpureus]KAG0631923.1 hypothetical protein M758_1G290500 [Ceratodon purpureus]